MYMDNKPLNRIKVVMAERMVSNKELGEMLNKDTATISRWVTSPLMYASTESWNRTLSRSVIKEKCFLQSGFVPTSKKNIKN